MRRLRWVLYGLFLVLLAEFSCRLLWAVSGVPFWSSPNNLHLFFYPELVAVSAEDIERGDDTRDILLLGGSVLDPQFHDIGGRLEKRLGANTRVHCVARPSHTSRDSLLKYRRLGDKKFDLVVFYHAINEARANNCPPDLFRDDYGHWGWYRLVNAAEAGGVGFTILPYAATFAWTKIGGKLGLIDLVPKHAPGPEWLAYGEDVKTQRSFRSNLTEICDLAQARGDKLLLMTFATHVAEDYSREKFEADQLDYAPMGLPIELWGTPTAVIKAVAAHNAVVRDLAATRASVQLVDQEGLMPRGKKFFEDICHLTEAGAERFVDHLEAGIRESGLLSR